MLMGYGEMMQDWVTRVAERRPEARAVVGTDRVLTYGELEALSNRCARLLREVGCEAGDRVAVLMPPSALAVASFIGALKAGCAYVPLDPKDGGVRRAYMLKRTEPRIVLAAGCSPDVVENLRHRSALGDARVGWLGEDDGPSVATFRLHDVQSSPDSPLDDDFAPERLAYILFTSGTSGWPKGVPISHRSVRAFIEWAVEYFGLGPDDRLPGHTALTFDLSTFDIYASLAAGAELHQLSQRSLLDPRQVPGFIESRGLTLWFSVPSQLSYVARFDALEGRSLDTLRHVAWCGDVLPPPSLAYWRERVPHAAFTNLYGPTETTVASSYYRVPDDHDPAADVPIGVACPGEELLVVDEHLRPVPDGEVGDICIRGVGLSPGYWRDPERSREVFVEGPESRNGSDRLYRTGDRGRRDEGGVVTFLGRADFQIKAAGYRVEPAEVESAVRRLPDVAACAVLPVKSSGFDGSAVGCAYVAANGTPLRAGRVKRDLADSLPGYMIPTRWLMVDELPTNHRGKIDRVRLQKLMGGGDEQR
jgi:amino acid adenylation domain-containing protein